MLFAASDFKCNKILNTDASVFQWEVFLDTRNEIGVKDMKKKWKNQTQNKLRREVVCT